MEKVCTQCGISKDAENDFYWRLQKQGRRREECKACSLKRNRTPQARASQRKCCAKWRAKYPEKARANFDNWARRNPDRLRHWRLQIKYGISLEEYERLLSEQNGACAICKKPPKEGDKNLSVDHDHVCCSGNKSCGKCVRGLLCQPCNAFLGFSKENLTIIDNAKEYLQKYAKSTKPDSGDEGQVSGVLGAISASDI